MAISFSCPQWGIHFTLDDSAAGKEGRCKRCRHTMTIPAKAPPELAVAASGRYRLGAFASPASELRLAPISEDFRPLVRQRELEEEDESPGGYDVAAMSHVDARVPSQPPSALRRAYRRQVCGGLDLAARLSEVVYLVTWPFILLLLVGAATGRRDLAVWGAIGVVLLSVGRLALDGFYLVAMHFKNNLLEGLLFFIPPLTFYYLAKHWKSVKRVAPRLFTSAALIAGVILAFVFVPTLSGHHP